jgi:Dynein heavy chain C-terminal domain
MFGMHVSADASLRLKESTALFQAVLALQPRENSYSTANNTSNSSSSSSSSSTASSDELVTAAARHVLSVLPHNVNYKSDSAVNALTRRGGGAGDSLLVVLVQELDRYYSNPLICFKYSNQRNCIGLKYLNSGQLQWQRCRKWCSMHI